MKRTSGTNTEFPTIQGCLNSLQESGLVCGHAGLWQRTKEPKRQPREEQHIELPTTVVDLKRFVLEDVQPSDMLRRLACLHKITLAARQLLGEPNLKPLFGDLHVQAKPQGNAP